MSGSIFDIIRKGKYARGFSMDIVKDIIFLQQPCKKIESQDEAKEIAYRNLGPGQFNETE